MQEVGHNVGIHAILYGSRYRAICDLCAGVMVVSTSINNKMDKAHKEG